MTFMVAIYLSAIGQTVSALHAAISDQLHLYYKDFAYYLYLSWLTIHNFFAAIFRFCRACFCHSVFLHKYQLNEYDGMMDIAGSYTASTTCYLEPEGNLVGSKPASRIMGFVNNATNNPAHLPISSLAVDMIWKVMDTRIDYADSVFIDFGCGVGTSMMMAMIQHPFKCVIGVELNPQTAKYCSNNIDRCIRELGGTVKCKNALVENIDMANFQLYTKSGKSFNDDSNSSSCPKASNVILFMYEPLWTISKLDANVIYKKVFRNLKSQCSSIGSNLYIAYFFAGKYSGDATPALLEMKPELLYSEYYPSLFFGGNEQMFVYKL